MPFRTTGLTRRDQDRVIEKAYDLACDAFGCDVADHPEWAPMRAAKLLNKAALRPEPDLFAAVLVAYISPTDLYPGRWGEGLSPRGLEIAHEIGAVIRQEKPIDKADPAARVALLARASLDIADISARCPQTNLDRPAGPEENAATPRAILEKTFSYYTSLFSPALGTTGETNIDAAYSAALGAIKMRLDAPRPKGLTTTWGVPDPAHYMN